MNEDVLALVQPQWRAAFVDFAETGEAPRSFLDYLDADPKAVQAVDLIVDEQIQRIPPVVFQQLAAIALDELS